MSKPIDPKYNGTLFRSTTARPLIYDPMIYQDYVNTDRAVSILKITEPSDLTLKARRILGLVKRYLLIKVRDLHRIANLLYFPTIDILIGGLIWLWREQSNPNLGHACAEYLFALIFWIITNSSQFETCFNFLEEFQSRNLLNLFSSTLEHSEWLITSAVLCILEALMSTTICSLDSLLGIWHQYIDNRLAVAVHCTAICCLRLDYGNYNCRAFLNIRTTGYILNLGNALFNFTIECPILSR